MLVRHMLEDLAEAMARLPASADFPIGVACYVEPADDTIRMSLVGSCHWDEDEFQLVVRGSGNAYGLDETKLTARMLLDELEQHPEIHEFPASVRACVDGADTPLHEGLWGTGFHEQERIVYFYYGAIGAPE